MAQISSHQEETQSSDSISETSLFFALPSEIRNHIYELFLPADEVFTAFFDGKSGTYRFLIRSTSRDLPSTLLVSRRFGKEVRAILYRANRFQIILGQLLLTRPFDPESPFPIKYLQLMRHVTLLYLPPLEYYGVPVEKIVEELGQFFGQFAKECAFFRTLSIELECRRGHKLSRALGTNQTMAVALAKINITNELSLKCFSDVEVKKTAFMALRRLIDPDTEWRFEEIDDVRDYFNCQWVWKPKRKPLLPKP